MKVLLLSLFLFFASQCFATDIQGVDVVRAGWITTYSVTWTNWDEDYDEHATVHWQVSNGTIISSNNNSISIQWEPWVGEEDGWGYIWVDENWNGQSAFYEVLVNNYPEGYTQLCDDGVLGPPTIYVDFGSGSNPGLALPSGRTTYTYSSSCALTPNHYSVVTNTNTCRGLWWQIPEDHTPNDVNGYMLMVDGNTSRGEVYRTTVTGLVAGTTYEFSAWAGNLYNITGAANPELTFEIFNQSGVRLGTSGAIVISRSGPFTWQKVGFKFEVPVGTTAVEIVLADQQRASGGNDFVVDDISFAPCYPPMIASFSPNPTRKNKEYICSNGSVNLYAWWPLSIQFSSPVYQWQRSTDNITWTNIAGANSVTSSYTETTPNIYLYRIYVYEAGNPSQNLVSNVLTYYVQTMVVEATTFDVYGCTGTATGQLQPNAYLQFADPSVTQSYTYAWSPGTNLSSTTIKNPTFTVSIPVPLPGGPPQAPTNYSFTFTVTNSNYGCSGSNAQTVIARAPRKVLTFNAFSPNGDGVNDVWRPHNLQDYPGAKLEIFNRWGQLIFTKTNGTTLLDYTWDGTFNGIPQPIDQYIWQINIPGCPTNISASEGQGVTAGAIYLVH